MFLTTRSPLIGAFFLLFHIRSGKKNKSVFAFPVYVCPVLDFNIQGVEGERERVIRRGMYNDCAARAGGRVVQQHKKKQGHR